MHSGAGHQTVTLARRQRFPGRRPQAAEAWQRLQLAWSSLQRVVPARGAGEQHHVSGSTKEHPTMLRTIVCAVVALLFCVGLTLAAEIKGKVKKVDADKGTITVT